MITPSDEEATISCPSCGTAISIKAAWCPHCHRPIITQRYATLYMTVGSLLTIVLTYSAARATLTSPHRVLIITLYLTLAMLCAIGTYQSYELLHQRRLALAEEGIDGQP